MMHGHVKAALVLADGTLFKGHSFGAPLNNKDYLWGEVVFNTSIFGYQEILTDPSYAGQILTFTNPHIGNVGCNSLDQESANVHAAGVVIRDVTKITSNFRAEFSFENYLKNNNCSGIYGIDTRALVRHLRDNGSQLGAIAPFTDSVKEELVEYLQQKDYSAINFVEKVTCAEPYEWNELPWDQRTNSFPKMEAADLRPRPHIVAIDCGIKYNILRLLTRVGFRVTVVPCHYNADQIASMNPAGIFISNGPGDPSSLNDLVNTTRELIGRFPIFGICLGHQLIAQAVGGSTYKLKFGHRGGNHPVRFEENKVIEISVQNHGYAVKMEGLPSDAIVSHLNLNDNTVEGLFMPKQKVLSVQYHPESSPGPHDAQYLFDKFYNLVVNA